jgi:hypothetical protein
MVPKRTRRLAETAHPIVDETHAHTFTRFGDERLGKHPARIVFVNDVALEVDVTLGGFDRLEPCGVILLRVDEQFDTVTADQRRPSRARESLVRQVTH